MLKLISNNARVEKELPFEWLADRSGIRDMVDEALSVLERASVRELADPEKRAKVEVALGFLSQGTDRAKAFCDSFHAAYLAMADAHHLIKEECAERSAQVRERNSGGRSSSETSAQSE